MKKILSIILLMVSFCFIVSGCTDPTRNYIEPEDLNHNEEVETHYFEAKILEIYENSILVEPIEGSSELKSSDKIDISIKNVDINFNLTVNNIISITYIGSIAESYPAQITGTIAINHISGDLIEDIDPTISDDTIEFNGKTYNKSDLSEATLNWLEMSEKERMLSSYYPFELLDNPGFADLDNIQEEWGITLTAENVTPDGLTIVCHQSGGENTQELNTGSFYTIQKLEEDGFKTIEYLSQEYDIAWTAEAWIIFKDATTTWDVNWKWLYGTLSPGEYRIGKEIMNFRGPGDYDTEMIYAHFEI